MKRNILILTLLIFSLTGIYSQVKDTIISKKDLIEDFQLFKSMLREAHPGIYRYTSKEEFEKAFSSVESQINRDINIGEFYKLTVPLVSLVKCAHTKYMPEGVNENKYYFNTGTLFPLRLYFVDNRAFLVNAIDNGYNKVPQAGTEVISINGKTIGEILQALWPFIFADGNGQALKYEEINQYFNGYYADFIDSSPEYKVEFIQKNGAKITEIYKAIPFSKIDKSMLQPKEPEKPYKLEFNNTTAIITISSFWKEDPKISFEKFLKNSFSEIAKRNCKSLIIDVRNNEGGMDKLGSLLYSYLTEDKFAYYKTLEMTTNKKYSFENNIWLPKPRWFLRWLIKEKEGKYYWTKHKNLKVQQPASEPYTGKVFILINGRSMSVTSEFCSIAFQNKRAMFIGDETGGAFQGNNSGAFAIGTLPHSRITLGIPLVAYYMAVDKNLNNDRGIIPHHAIVSTIDDIINERDPVMEFALMESNN